jgi:hypothetical protein
VSSAADLPVCSSHSVIVHLCDLSFPSSSTHNRIGETPVHPDAIGATQGEREFDSEITAKPAADDKA